MTDITVSRDRTPETRHDDAPSAPVETVTPLTDIFEGTDAIHLEMDVPGATEDALELRVEEGLLVLQAEAPRFHGQDIVRRYRRSFVLPDHVRTDDVTATLERGVLHVTLPRREEAKPRKIPVDVR